MRYILTFLRVSVFIVSTIFPSLILIMNFIDVTQNSIVNCFLFYVIILKWLENDQYKILKIYTYCHNITKHKLSNVAIIKKDNTIKNLN